MYSCLGTVNIVLLRKEFGSKSQVSQGPGRRPSLALPIMPLVLEHSSLSICLHIDKALDWPGSQRLDAEKFGKIA